MSEIISTPPSNWMLPSLDFPERNRVTVHEIARLLRITTQHVKNLIDRGELTDEPLTRPKVKRRLPRVSVVSFRSFIARRTIGPAASAAVPARLHIPSLDFTRAAPLTLRDVAQKLDVTEMHVSVFIHRGQLGAVDLRGQDRSDVSTYRIPIEAYRSFVQERLVTVRSQAGA